MRKSVIRLKSVPNKRECVWYQLDGLTDLRRVMADCKARGGKSSITSDDDDDFYGEGYATVQQFALRGDAKSLASVKAAKFDLPVKPAEIKRKAWDVQGSGFQYAVAMTGNPMTCYTKRRDKVEHAPVTLLHDCAVACTTNRKTIAARGAAIMALLDELTVTHPVTLHLVYGVAMSGKDMIVSLAIDCRTLDRQSLAWLLISPTYLRRAMFSISYNKAMHGLDTLSGLPPLGQLYRDSEQSKWRQEFLTEHLREPGGTVLETPGAYMLSDHKGADFTKWVQDRLVEARQG